MKIRMGFVSNSSSSSFIVSVFKDYFEKSDKIISENVEKRLIKFGFKKTSVINPEQYEQYKEDKAMVYIAAEDLTYNYGYSVICNQDEVISFLIKNRIPFTASEHYNHYKLFYKGGDTIYKIANFGEIFYEQSGDIEKNIGELLIETKAVEKDGKMFSIEVDNMESEVLALINKLEDKKQIIIIERTTT